MTIFNLTSFIQRSDEFYYRPEAKRNTAAPSLPLVDPETLSPDEASMLEDMPETNAMPNFAPPWEGVLDQLAASGEIISPADLLELTVTQSAMVVVAFMDQIATIKAPEWVYNNPQHVLDLFEAITIKEMARSATAGSLHGFSRSSSTKAIGKTEVICLFRLQ